MNLRELMDAYNEAHGDIEFQKLDEVVLSFERAKRGGTKVTFATDVDFDLHGLKEAGIILWFNRQWVVEIMNKHEAEESKKHEAEKSEDHR